MKIFSRSISIFSLRKIEKKKATASIKMRGYVYTVKKKPEDPGERRKSASSQEKLRKAARGLSQQ